MFDLVLGGVPGPASLKDFRPVTVVSVMMVAWIRDYSAVDAGQRLAHGWDVV